MSGAGVYELPEGTRAGKIFAWLSLEIPRPEVRKAQAYRADFLSRFDEKKLREAIHEEF